jgi:RNA recognition motif-containing protein
MQLVSVVIKRNKETGQSEGFGFLNFADHEAADLVLQSYHGQKMPNTDRDFALNWAWTTPGKHADHVCAIYAGDLSLDVKDFMLYHLFKSRYPSVKSAKVAWDDIAGCSKGYGFVMFGDVNECRQAMNEMNGAYCSTKRMRVSPATNKDGMASNEMFHISSFVATMQCDLNPSFLPLRTVANVYLGASFHHVALLKPLHCCKCCASQIVSLYLYTILPP